MRHSTSLTRSCFGRPFSSHFSIESASCESISSKNASSDSVTQQVIQWIGLRENLNRKPWFLLVFTIKYSKFSCIFFPSSNSMSHVPVETYGNYEAMTPKSPDIDDIESYDSKNRHLLEAACASFDWSSSCAIATSLASRISIFYIILYHIIYIIWFFYIYILYIYYYIKMTSKWYQNDINLQGMLRAAKNGPTHFQQPRPWPNGPEVCH